MLKIMVIALGLLISSPCWADCMTQVIYHEARGEPLAGKIGVGSVVLNRVADGRFGEGVCGVVWQPKQFSNIEKRAFDKSSADWAESKRVAQCLMTGGAWCKDNTGGALYFLNKYDVGGVKPKWMRGLRFNVRLGNHWFYSHK